MKINKNLLTFETENLFSQVTQKVSEHKKITTNKVVSLGIGDVSKPIVEPVIKAMKKAVEDLSKAETFKGYGAYFGYDFLKTAIIENDYKDLDIKPEEVYVSNGTKTDTTSILEMFDNQAKVLITDPMYPIYRDGSKSLNVQPYFLKLSEEQDFIPSVPKEKYDIIFMCSPNNPIGIAYTKTELKKWVDYAIRNNAVILYDNVYEAFIESSDVPHSIYEVEGAKQVAIEFRSFSKNASFTGVRCSYYVVPNELYPDINVYWKRRTMNRFNGADYIAQYGAKESYTQEARELISQNVKYYKNNAKCLLNSFTKMGFKVYGGVDSPYLWIKTKDNKTSWEMFNIFLKNLDIIIIPGIVFGKGGDGYFRVSSLGKYEDVLVAIDRMEKYFK